MIDRTKVTIALAQISECCFVQRPCIPQLQITGREVDIQHATLAMLDADARIRAQGSLFFQALAHATRFRTELVGVSLAAQFMNPRSNLTFNRASEFQITRYRAQL